MPSSPAAILVVDDNAHQRISLRAVLEQLGTEVVEAASGGDALRQLLRREFAVILLDVNMPGIDGFETAEFIRRHRSSDTPIIFVSADDDHARAARGYSLGAVDYIASPVNPQILKAKVSVFLQLFRKREELSWHARTRQRLADAALAIHRSRSLEELLELVAQSARSILGAAQAAIEIRAFAIGSSAGATETVRRSLAQPPNTALLELARRALPHLPLQPIRLSSTELAVDRWSFRATEGLLPLEGWLAAPLQSRDGSPLGWLHVSAKDRDQGEFGEDDEALLVHLAQLTSIAAENSLLAEAQRANRVGTSLLQELDEERVLQVLTDEATQATGASFGAFFFNVENDNGERYMLYTLSGAPRSAFERFPLPRATPIFSETFRGKGPVRLTDVRQDPRFGAWGRQPEGHLPVVSYLAVPVMAPTGKVLGGLFLSHVEPGRFTAEHERLLLGIGKQAAIALENARLYSELRKSEARVRTAYEAAALADQRKDQFLAMLSHELRNPLAPIVSGLHLLRLQGQQGAELDVLERQAAHLVRLVDDLLDISRIQRGTLELQRERVELSRIVAHAAETAAPLLTEKQHRFSVHVPEGLFVDGDFTRLAQVVENLIHNAAKFTPAGGEIHVDAAREDKELVLEVEDNGRGVPPELLPYLFDAFTQGEQSIDRSSGGLGLGLAIVRQLVEMHGGSVTCESAGTGDGSRFVVRLPAAGPTTSTPMRAAAAQPAQEENRVRRKILVVDDNADAADMVAFALRHNGHEVRTAADGAEALQIASEFEPVLAVLDLGLPGMDGYELAQRLRELQPELLLLALSGYGQQRDRAQSRDAGFDGHLVKPADLNALEEAIQRLMNAKA